MTYDTLGNRLTSARPLAVLPDMHAAHTLGLILRRAHRTAPRSRQTRALHAATTSLVRAVGATVVLSPTGAIYSQRSA